MSENKSQSCMAGRQSLQHEELSTLLKARYEAADQVRRGVCLLNAGRYDQAEMAFKRAMDHGCIDESLPAYLAACLLGEGKPDAAAGLFAEAVAQNETEASARIRHALTLWYSGNSEAAIQSLRDGMRQNPECAELHLQLGMLLTSQEKYEEAELRFTQAVNIDRDHTEALVSLALCCGIRNAPDEAVLHLQRAQTRRPHDARIGLLLAQAAKAARQQGHSIRLRADMPHDPGRDDRGIEELSRVIEADPDFVDAFLALPTERADERIFAMLLKTLKAALGRHPEHAELHYHCGRVLSRLGRNGDAINENERAVEIDPTFTRALIELGKLYQQTDRSADATTRLERAIAAGAEYADVYYLLGNLYRDQGQVTRARSAYRRALLINDRYEAAMEALEALPAA
ncbi:MAG: tetratricopeptide repeat protein [Phycisphaerales bacterium]|nr:MAG: tetratricopeptide repeat protein [Phycisphaerales bacterium]